ncbi:hypothetical protein MGU_08206 [Metarhizium guizhouense ARSEF 977]|uniref:Uncharacterized protein n=1 Tax=Metarhizium guizhouense (strain ARSEF 977) TaxID=1276136 RepID=A0A0B4GXY6_METGA|nr:hypothetical protein MGU_08206 [Metarhizium guizhouense ARSEF 977]
MDYYRRHEAECEKKVPPASVDAARLPPRRSEVAWPEKPVAISDFFKQTNGKMDRGAKESDPFAYQAHRHITTAADFNGLDDKVPPPATPSPKSLAN